MNDNRRWASFGKVAASITGIYVIVWLGNFAYSETYAAGANSRQHEVQDLEQELKVAQEKIELLLGAVKTEVAHAERMKDYTAACVQVTGIRPSSAYDACNGIRIVRKVGGFEVDGAK